MSLRIRRDEWGVPYVSASSEADAYRGLGYATADDHLERLLRAYATVRSELALVDGPDGVASDLFHHRWQTLVEARAGFERLDARSQLPFEAFVDGVARYVREHHVGLPSWAPPLEPALPIAVSRAGLWGWMIGDGLAACAAAGIAVDATNEPAEAARARASNAWAVSGARTATGETFLLADPHIPLDAGPDRPKATAGGLVVDSALLRSTECVVRAGDLAFAGFLGVGAIALVVGHTRRCAWGMTTGGPRVSDVYRLPSSQPTERQDVTVEVRGGDSVTKALEHVVLNGVRAPVVARDDGGVYALCTPYMHTAELLDRQALQMLRAGDVRELRETFRVGGWFPQNVVAADADGGLLYLRAGRVPVRAPGVDPSRPVDGSTSTTAWRGLHDLDALVQVVDPPDGFVQNCNSAPDTVTPSADATLGAQRFPAEVYNDTPGRQTTRSLRVTEVLANAVGLTVDDATRLALDELWPDTPAWQAALRCAAATAGVLLGADAAEVLECLLAFDGQARAESVSALAWHVWRESVFLAGVADPAELRAMAMRIGAGEPLKATDADLLVGSLAAAADVLFGTYGGLATPYGAVHRLGDGDGGVPVGGGILLGWVPTGADDTMALVAPLRVHLFPARPADGSPVNAVYGGPMLRLTALGQRPRSWSALLPGQRSRPDGEHTTDQCRLVSERRLKLVELDRTTGSANSTGSRSSR